MLKMTCVKLYPQLFISVSKCTSKRCMTVVVCLDDDEDYDREGDNKTQATCRNVALDNFVLKRDTMERLDQCPLHPLSKHPVPGRGLVTQTSASQANITCNVRCSKELLKQFYHFYSEPLDGCPSACGHHTCTNTGSAS
jgi:hypothetical protein